MYLEDLEIYEDLQYHKIASQQFYYLEVTQLYGKFFQYSNSNEQRIIYNKVFNFSHISNNKTVPF